MPDLLSVPAWMLRPPGLETDQEQAARREQFNVDRLTAVMFNGIKEDAMKPKRAVDPNTGEIVDVPPLDEARATQLAAAQAPIRANAFARNTLGMLSQQLNEQAQSIALANQFNIKQGMVEFSKWYSQIPDMADPLNPAKAMEFVAKYPILGQTKEFHDAMGLFTEAQRAKEASRYHVDQVLTRQSIADQTAEIKKATEDERKARNLDIANQAIARSPGSIDYLLRGLNPAGVAEFRKQFPDWTPGNEAAFPKDQLPTALEAIQKIYADPSYRIESKKAAGVQVADVLRDMDIRSKALRAEAKQLRDDGKSEEARTMDAQAESAEQYAKDLREHFRKLPTSSIQEFNFRQKLNEISPSLANEYATDLARKHPDRSQSQWRRDLLAATKQITDPSLDDRQRAWLQSIIDSANAALGIEIEPVVTEEKKEPKKIFGIPVPGTGGTQSKTNYVATPKPAATPKSNAQTKPNLDELRSIFDKASEMLAAGASAAEVESELKKKNAPQDLIDYFAGRNTDPSIPEKYFPKEAMPTVRTKAEFDSLPAGTVYIGKDGKKYRKP